MRLLGREPFFDLSTAAQLTSEDRVQLRTQLSRWMKAGKLLSLRRGMYTFAEPYRGTKLNPAQLANHLYRPSYLSGLWALSYYGLIPEKVELFTSVTTRVPRRFENAFGTFAYRHIKQSGFSGYAPITIGDAKVLLAKPEKALIDIWYLSEGEWTEERMREMRFALSGSIDPDTLMEYARRMESPRLERAVDVCLTHFTSDEEGTREL